MAPELQSPFGVSPNTVNWEDRQMKMILLFLLFGAITSLSSIGAPVTHHPPKKIASPSGQTS
jgi:hypothetical protein